MRRGRIVGMRERRRMRDVRDVAREAACVAMEAAVVHNEGLEVEPRRSERR